MIKHKKKLNHKKGFTLLETLVAIFILTLALTGPIYIATLAIRGSVESRDNISAYYLAEEAIEAIRNKRDEISLTNDNDAEWLNGITGDANCKNSSSEVSLRYCYMTREGSTGKYKFIEYSGNPSPLSFNPTGNSIIYGEDGVGFGESKFTREIYLKVADQDGSTNSDANREVDVVVTVKWEDRGRDRQLQLIERLHNQQYADYYIE